MFIGRACGVNFRCHDFEIVDVHIFSCSEVALYFYHCKSIWGFRVVIPLNSLNSGGVKKHDIYARRRGQVRYIFTYGFILLFPKVFLHYQDIQATMINRV